MISLPEVIIQTPQNSSKKFLSYSWHVPSPQIKQLYMNLHLVTTNSITWISECLRCWWMYFLTLDRARLTVSGFIIVVSADLIHYFLSHCCLQNHWETSSGDCEHPQQMSVNLVTLDKIVGSKKHIKSGTIWISALQKCWSIYYLTLDFLC